LPQLFADTPADTGIETASALPVHQLLHCARSAFARQSGYLEAALADTDRFADQAE
jgi:hypothetical protein